jgi:hypothetical protein
MKSSIILAFLFYLLALFHILDWIFFWNRHKELASSNHKAFKQLYNDHFPNFLEPLLSPNSRIESFIIMVLLIIAGFILLKENRIIYKIVGINAFIFAAWYLFSLM